jgi:hypothetical protein
MANDQPRTPSWKNQGAANRPAANVSRKPWQPTGKPAASGPADPRSRFRKRLLAAGVTGSLLIAAVIVVIWLWRPPKQPALVVIAPETSATLAAAPNVYGANSAKEFAEWAKQGKDRPRLAAEPKETTTRDSWKAPLGKVNEKTVVLYFAAHGAADRNGPYLWMTPPDATTIDESHKLPVKEILQRLAELPKDKQKLLIFDATQVDANWAQGFLHNDFTRALKGLDGEIEKVDNLVVICSSDDDQRSWVSEEWRQTIFGHFLNQGVRGGAGKDKPRVTAAILHEYLAKEVSNWTRANRDAEQTPILLPVGSGRGRAEKIEVVSIDAGNYQSPAASSAPGNAFTTPGELTSAWETAARLADADSGVRPETAAPQVWRAYLDTLLRWQSLVRAGGPTEAIAHQAEALQRELSQGLFDTDPPCLANSLSVPAAFGIRVKPINAAKFSEVWSPAKDRKTEDAWKETVNATRAKEGERGVALLRLAAASRVLQIIALPESGATPENLTRAREVLEIVDESQPRPAETQLLMLLERDLAADKKQRPDADLILKVLNLRIQAERIAWLAGGKDTGSAHADQVYRWIEKSLSEADRKRQWAEDLLLPSDKDSWEKARGYLKAAEDGYNRCAIDAASAAEALRTRDLIFSRLPYYARWVASYRGGLPQSEVERLLQLVETVADNTHQLAEKLEDVPEKPAARLSKIADLTGRVKAGFAELHRVFDSDTGSLGGTVLPSNWHAIDNALSVPFLPVDRRTKLLQDLRSISRHLNDKSQTQSAPTSATPFNAKEWAQRQGRMALALLGDRWVEDAEARAGAPRGSVSLHFGDLKQRILQPNVGAWWDSLNEAGEQIGWHWRAIPSAVSADLDEAGQVELKVAPKHLTRAGRLARLADSATPLAKGRSPANEERRYWTHVMLLGQARRTIDDGYAAVATGLTGRQYCVEAGERYAQAAEKLILGPNPALETHERNRRLARVKETRDRLKAPDFSLVWDKVEDRTDDKEWSLSYRVAPEPGRPVGFPTLRITSAAAPFRIADQTLQPRLPLLDFADREKPAAAVEKRIPFAFESKKPEEIAGQVRVDLLYRGQIFEMTTRVTLTGLPDIEWAYESPSGKARFGIIGGKDLRQGAVALIVDQTLSMNDPIKIKDAQGREVDGPIKIKEAVKALEEVLEGLPADTMLSVGVFHGDVKGALKLRWLTDQPIRWGETAIEKKAILAKVRGIVPPDDAKSTPLAEMLVRLISSPRGDAFPVDFAGFRNIVVLTDGDDNCSADPQNPTAPGELVVRALRAARHDIAVHMILFGLDEKEEERATKQFEPLKDLKNFEDLNLTPGTIWPSIRKREELVEKLKESMVPKVQVFRGVENGERLPDGLHISLPGEGFRRYSRSLEPGTYQLRALGSRKLLHLEPGDRVLLEMRRDEKRMDLRLPLWADVFAGVDANLRADSSNGQVHLTLAKNSLTDRGKGNDLMMVATLEKRSQGRLEELRVERPWFVWFEALPKNAADGARPSHLRIANLKDCVPPAWEVAVGPWAPERGKTDARNDPALPAVDAWWVDAFPGDPGRMTISRLQALDTEFAKNKDVTVDGSTVIINDISVRDGFLYLNATHKEGKPIVVRVVGLKKDEQRLQLGELHRYFTKAGKYTARFGPIEKADYGRQLTFQFYSLDSLKKVASHARLEPEKPEKDSSARDLLPRVKAEE